MHTCCSSDSLSPLCSHAVCKEARSVRLIPHVLTHGGQGISGTSVGLPCMGLCTINMLAVHAQQAPTIERYSVQPESVKGWATPTSTPCRCPSSNRQQLRLRSEGGPRLPAIAAAVLHSRLVTSRRLMCHALVFVYISASTHGSGAAASQHAACTSPWHNNTTLHIHMRTYTHTQTQTQGPTPTHPTPAACRHASTSCNRLRC